MVILRVDVDSQHVGKKRVGKKRVDRQLADMSIYVHT
jgi:hypothetical protein